MLRHGNQSLNVTFKKYELIWGYKATETQYLASVQYIFLEAYSIERQGMGKKKTPLVVQNFGLIIISQQ